MRENPFLKRGANQREEEISHIYYFSGTNTKRRPPWSSSAGRPISEKWPRNNDNEVGDRRKEAVKTIPPILAMTSHFARGVAEYLRPTHDTQEAATGQHREDIAETGAPPTLPTEIQLHLTLHLADAHDAIYYEQVDWTL